MLAELRIHRVSSSRLGEVDMDDLGFGTYFADHMFSMMHDEGSWRQPQIVPFAPVPVHPANAALHYGQAVFEGLKAYRGSDGRVRIFRPDRNAERLESSCDRLCVPHVPRELFVTAIERLVAIDHAWIPPRRGQALYVRPIVFADEGHLEVRPSRRYRFLIITSPVRAYFDAGMKPIALKAESAYTRSAPGGVGFAKTAGNYGASLYPGKRAQDAGYQQLLWLDGIEHRYVEEVGAMNIFFRFDEHIVTPDLHGTILPGVTRDSVISLLEDAGQRVQQRRIAIEEVIDGARSGRLREVFATGTAAIVAPVGTIAYGDRDTAISNGEAGEMTRWLYEQLTGMQHCEIADRFGWCHVIDIGPGA